MTWHDECEVEKCVTIRMKAMQEVSRGAENDDDDVVEYA